MWLFYHLHFRQIEEKQEGEARERKKAHENEYFTILLMSKMQGGDNW